MHTILKNIYISYLWCALVNVFVSSCVSAQTHGHILPWYLIMKEEAKCDFLKTRLLDYKIIFYIIWGSLFPIKKERPVFFNDSGCS